MSPPIATSSSTSASGYEDGFGRRGLAFDREDGAILEQLYLRPEFSIYERSLKETFARLAPHCGEHIVAPRALEKDRVSGELVAVSPFVTGERLSDLLDAASEHAREEGAVPGIEVALGFLLDVLPTLEALHSATGLSHGAVAPSRCVLTTDGRVVLTECGFAPVLQRLNPSRHRLWREFRVALPPVAGSVRFDSGGDVSQAALMSVMLVLGRPMTDADAADVLPDLMAEVIEIAQIRSNVTFAINLQRFLQRALPLPGRRPYESVDAALQDVRQLASGIGIALCQASLAEFVRHMASPGAAPGAPPVLVAGVHDVVEPRPTASFDVLSKAPEPHRAIPDPPPVDDVEWPAIDSIIAAADVAVPHIEELEPVVVPETRSEGFEWQTTEEATSSAPDETQEPEVEPTPAPPAFVEEPQPEPARESRAARRRRSRANAKRNQDDGLRSVVAPAPVPEPVHVPVPAPEPEPVPALVAAPAIEMPPPAIVMPAPAPAPVPVAVQPIPIAPQPVFPQPVFPQPVIPQPVIPQPAFGALPIPATEPLWQPSAAAAPQVPVAPPLRLTPKTIQAPTPVRLKTKPPPGFSPAASRYESHDFPAPHSGTRSSALSGSGRRSWTFAAAAAVVLIAIAAAARSYFPDTDSLQAETKNGAAPTTVAAPPPVTTGTIVVQTQPAGARVLLDGSPAGETPLRIVDVAPGRHVLTFVTASATVKRTVKVEADKTLTLEVPVFSGWVAVFAPIVLEVSEEGRALGTTEDGRLMLAPGRHTLTLTNREFGYSASHAVEIEAGEVKSLNVKPLGTVNLNAVPWAEVWIDGKKAGETPLANLELTLGNREIIFRHPELGERRTMTKITAGAATAVTVDFSK
jgi:PEGA domain